MPEVMSRRGLLGGAVAVAGAVVTSMVSPTDAARAVPTETRTWRNSRSANGWPVLPHTDWHAIEGSGMGIRLAGDAALILTHVARRYHYEIDRLREADVHGHITDRRVGERYESNYLSGSALAIHPKAFPIGVRGGLYPEELVVVRDILAELEGVVTWGGDFHRPKESHFEIAYRPGHPKVTAIANRIAEWTDGPGARGAGSIDAFNPTRRARAEDFARRGR